MATKTTRSKAASAGSRAADAPLRRFYAGEAIPCPIGCGGTAHPVRVSTTEAGGGEVWVECSACAQRSKLEAKPATPAERKKVAAGLEEGQEPVCPRHTQRVVLRRRGRQLACPDCGVVYRE